MSFRIIAATVAAALIVSVTTATAQTSKKAQLLPGGNTIAGPGARTLGAAGTEVVFSQSATTPMDLCATVMNVGKKGTLVSVVVIDPSMIVSAQSAEAGESVAACQKGSNVVRVQCSSGEECQALWRVDQSR